MKSAVQTDNVLNEVKEMPVKERITDDERDELTKDVDDLDKAYIEKMKAAGIDEDLLAQFASIASQVHSKEDNE